MAGIAMLEGWTITSVETIQNYSHTDDTCLCILDEIKNVSLANSEDTTDVTGKNNQALFTIKRNKAVTGSGSSGSGETVSGFSQEATVTAIASMLTNKRFNFMFIDY